MISYQHQIGGFKSHISSCRSHGLMPTGDPDMPGSFSLLSLDSERTIVSGNFNIKSPIADPTSGDGTGRCETKMGFQTGEAGEREMP